MSYTVLHPDGSVSNKTWYSLEDVQLSLNQGRLRFWPPEAVVLKDEENGYKAVVGTLASITPEKTTCPHCNREF